MTNKIFYKKWMFSLAKLKNLKQSLKTESRSKKNHKSEASYFTDAEAKTTQK